MGRRMLWMLLVFVLVVGALGAIKFFQIRAAIAQGGSFKPPPEAVTTALAAIEEWPSTLDGIGTVEAVQGVVLGADLGGIVQSIQFESGNHAAAGQVLVRLNTAQEEAQLAQAVAQADLARLNLDRGRKLLDSHLIAQSDFDALDAQSREADASVQGIRATIARKTIRAPFTGLLGIRQVNLGQHLNDGQEVVELQSLDPVFVNFALPQQALGRLRVGAPVEVSADTNFANPVQGRVTAVNSVVDEATRNVTIQATLRNPGERLRPGMYVHARVRVGEPDSVIALPATAINYAPYGNSIFVVEQLKDPKGQAYQGVSQRFVQVGRARGDLVAIVSGVKPGEQVVTSGVFKLRPGAAVTINNSIQPASSPTPDPGNS